MTNPADIPPPLPWDQRAKGVLPMPGGYTGYIDSLRRICGHVAGERPPLSDSELAGWIQGHFEVSSGSANSRVSFLRKAGVLELTAGQAHLSEWASRWYMTDDNGILIGHLHRRVRHECGERAALYLDSSPTRLRPQAS